VATICDAVKKMIRAHLTLVHVFHAIPTTSLLPIAYTTKKHSILSLCFFHRGNQSGLVMVFLVQLGFHQTPILKCTIMLRNSIQGGCKVLALV
jgi:hypothetical protein